VGAGDEKEKLLSVHIRTICLGPYFLSVDHTTLFSLTGPQS